MVGLRKRYHIPTVSGRTCCSCSDKYVYGSGYVPYHTNYTNGIHILT